MGRDADIFYIKFRGSKVKEVRMLCKDAYMVIDDGCEFVGI